MCCEGGEGLRVATATDRAGCSTRRRRVVVSAVGQRGCRQSEQHDLDTLSESQTASQMIRAIVVDPEVGAVTGERSRPGAYGNAVGHGVSAGGDVSASPEYTAHLHHDPFRRSGVE